MLGIWKNVKYIHIQSSCPRERVWTCLFRILLFAIIANSLPNPVTCHEGGITSDVLCQKEWRYLIKITQLLNHDMRGRSMAIRDIASCKRPRDEGENILHDSKCKSTLSWLTPSGYLLSKAYGCFNIQKTSTMCTHFRRWVNGTSLL